MYVWPRIENRLLCPSMSLTVSSLERIEVTPSMDRVVPGMMRHLVRVRVGVGVRVRARARVRVRVRA